MTEKGENIMTQSAKEFFQSLKENPELGKQFETELKKIAAPTIFITIVSGSTPVS